MSQPQDKPVDTSATTAGSSPGLDAAVEYLVQQRLLLTALELHQELLERGEENGALKQLFTTGKLLDELNDNAAHPLNQQLVRRPVVRSTNSYQEMDSRVALLEYELRQERQTTQALRQELSLLWNRKKKEDQAVASEGEAAYSQLEKRALSYLIKKFLLDQGLKLTAISLTEELEDSMDTWASVGQMFGINTKEPPSLMSIYRYFYNSGENKYEFGFKDALDKATRDNAALKEQLRAKDEELQRVKREQLQEIEALHTQLTQLDEPVQAVVKGDIISLEEFKTRVTQLKSVTQREQSSAGDNKTSAVKDKKEHKPAEHSDKDKKVHRIIKKRDLSSLFPREEVGDDTSKRISEQVTKLRVMEENRESVIDVLSTALPYIVSGVILKKREELIPVLLMAIRFHPVEEKRTQLTQLLFNLVKIPTEHQRKSILDGWEWLAQLQGPDRVAQELLPSCWEQINNKYAERRVLVAECAGRLGSAVTAEMRASLLVSIVTSLLGDTEPSVRRSATANLARLLLPRPDDIEAARVDEKKYKDLRDLLMKTLHDSDTEVKNIARQVLLPVFTDWVEREEYLFPKFANSLLEGISAIVNRLASFKRVDKGKRIEAKDTRELELHCQLLSYVIKHSHDSVMTCAPFYRNEELEELHDSDVKLPSVPHLAAASSVVTAAITPANVVNAAASSGADYLTVFKPNERQFIRKKFDDFIATLYSAEDSYKTWGPFDWLINDLLNKLMSYVMAIDTCYSDMVYQLTNVVATLCVTFTPAFTERVVKSKIERQLKQVNTEEEDSDVREMKRERLVQFYLVGVLSHLKSEVLMAFLKELLMNIALGEKGWSTKSIQLLSDSVVMICQQSMEKKEQILNMLWDLVVNPSSEVRFVVIKVMQSMITILTHNELMNRVLPALVTMSSDPDRKVRMGTIKTFTHLASNTTDEAVLAKVSIPLESFLNDSNSKTVVETLNTLVPIIPNVSAKFRDSFILSTLIKVTENNNSNKKESERREVANALFEAYRAFNGVRMNKETTTQFIRGLKALQRDVDLLGQNRNLLSMMVTDMEKALQSANRQQETAQPSNPLGINLSMLGLGGGTATPATATPGTAGTAGTPNNNPAQPNDPNAHGFMGNMLSYFKMN